MANYPTKIWVNFKSQQEILVVFERIFMVHFRIFHKKSCKNQAFLPGILTGKEMRLKMANNSTKIWVNSKSQQEILVVFERIFMVHFRIYHEKSCKNQAFLPGILTGKEMRLKMANNSTKMWVNFKSQ